MKKKGEDEVLRLLNKATSKHAPRLVSVKVGHRTIWRSTATAGLAAAMAAIPPASGAAAVATPVADADPAPAASEAAAKAAVPSALPPLVFAGLAPLGDDGIKVSGYS